MPNGTVTPPLVSVGSGGDPWVTYYDSNNNWRTHQVNDPTNLLNGSYIVTAIGGVNICSGWWAFAYEVKDSASYPPCRGNFGNFNNGDSQRGAYTEYSGLMPGTCPSTVFQWKHNRWMREGYG
jgi:hypothetical protein